MHVDACDKTDDGYSECDIAVLIEVLHQGEIMGRYGGIYPWPDVERQKKKHRLHAR